MTQHNRHSALELNVISLSVTFFLLLSECHYGDCQYTECHYAECHYIDTIMLRVIILNVIMLSVIMLVIEHPKLKIVV